ncbi:hypothetical protein CORC01_08926 [Colletotrichum orchidophilum]|uniref:Uncharacterized protein n=1 Tax=Colletotrichum orchidophilum TaxID=1209926 RepID=A0A1G4B388_9PEZI|nr:uncharacterized protein CORC01_08926 [Colletotrichum orchidophilum]OHE95785.1 hypothetical protein CORC01_08926 [Colletotrichum orchidophilum]
MQELPIQEERNLVSEHYLAEQDSNHHQRFASCLLPTKEKPLHLSTSITDDPQPPQPESNRTEQSPMPSIAEEHPRLMASGRKRRRDVNDANTNNELQLQGPLHEKLAQYQAATNNWNADGVFGGRPIQQQIQQQQQQQQSIFPRFPSSNNDLMRFQYGFPSTIVPEDSRQNLDSLPRKIAPLPVAKRQRVFHDDNIDHVDLGSLNSDPTPQHDPQQRRGSRSSTESHPTSHAARDQADAAGNRPKTPSSLAPCHICHRRPTKKSDLDSFADCQGCGQRSCYVCVRECQGWEKDGRPSSNGGINSAQQEQEEHGGVDLSRSCTMDDVDDDRQRQSRADEESKRTGQATRHDGWTGGGHRQMVCSRCCIEKGTEGDVVCLGCLSRIESV